MYPCGVLNWLFIIWRVILCLEAVAASLRSAVTLYSPLLKQVESYEEQSDHGSQLPDGSSLSFLDPLNIIGRTGITPPTPPLVVGHGHAAPKKEVIKKEEGEINLVTGSGEGGGGDLGETCETESMEDEEGLDTTETDYSDDPDWTPRTGL